MGGDWSASTLERISGQQLLAVGMEEQQNTAVHGTVTLDCTPFTCCMTLLVTGF